MKVTGAATRAYFDCNATTPTHEDAARAALHVMRTLYGNPSSSHLVGLQAKSILESSRQAAGQVVGADPDRIIFTSGATEAIQTGIFSALLNARDRRLPNGTRLLYGATEHKAVPEALHHWVRALALPYEVVELAVDGGGQLRLDQLERSLPGAALLCTMAVNNETGVIQDLAAIQDLLARVAPETLWLVDCVQALGKLTLALRESRIDYAPFSGHKLYAPKGVGFLYASPRAPLVPLIVGGGQERGLRSGTENLPGVAALEAVLELLRKPRGETGMHSQEALAGFRARLAEELRRAFPKVVFNAPFGSSVPTTLNFSVPGFSSRELMDLFDSAGLRLSAGSACSSTSVRPSHVLSAMGLEEWRSTSALRISFGPFTPEAEIDRGCQVIRDAAMALQTSCLLEAPGGFDAPASLRDGVIQLRAGAANSWIIADRANRTCVVIDPTETLAERIEHYIRCQDLQVLAVVDTHSHADHESIRPLLQKVLLDRLVPSLGGFDGLGWPQSATSVKLDDGTSVPVLRLGLAKQPADGGKGRSDAGGELVLARLATPGHTLDSHALILGVAREGRLARADVRFVFCGDTILSGGLGRTNFVISDPAQLYASLGKLRAALDPSTLLCPAHDYSNSFATTLGTETRENPLLGLTVTGALDAFLAKKAEIDTELERLEAVFQGTVCGVSNAAASMAMPDDTLSLPELQAALGAARAPLVIDVREPQEFSVFDAWEGLGLGAGQTPRNVPLSRFVNFMGELAAAGKPDLEVIIICRSGSRSLQAAKSLRRHRLARARSLSGGLAFAVAPALL